MPHILTVDVEDWFHTQALSQSLTPDAWEEYPVRIHSNLSRLLELFQRHQTKATFFVLGWVAEKFPELVELILEAGHEIASHGYAHQLIYNQSQEDLRVDLWKNLEILERIAGVKVLGYRAPSFFIRDGYSWVFLKLNELGIRYDSSIFPIWHGLYGIPSAPAFPFRLSCRRMK